MTNVNHLEYENVSKLPRLFNVWLLLRKFHYLLFGICLAIISRCRQQIASFAAALLITLVHTVSLVFTKKIRSSLIMQFQNSILKNTTRTPQFLKYLNYSIKITRYKILINSITQVKEIAIK